ncbi:MAG: PaaI family thioesterase [Kofleriaceae bacterium]|nr:PaaI family thioesterase [Kofleriaceae bacterium]
MADEGADATNAALADAQRKAKQQLGITFAANVPHNKALGIVFEAFEDNGIVFRLPYDARLVGNPETGVLHGGVITALLDGCSGAAVFAAQPRWPIATLDLRIDYLRAAEPGRAVLAFATCYKVTRNVGFTRAIAYHDNRDEPIASAVATFMLATKRGDAATTRATAGVAPAAEGSAESASSDATGTPSESTP